MEPDGRICVIYILDFPAVDVITLLFIQFTDSIINIWVCFDRLPLLDIVFAVIYVI